MILRVRGIANCDRCRAARKWLEQRGIAHKWLDLRDAPLDEAEARGWLNALGADTLVNRRSMTWRALPEDERPGLESDAWPALLVRQPTLIRRPLFERDDELRLGFDDSVRAWLEAR